MRDLAFLIAISGVGLSLAISLYGIGEELRRIARALEGRGEEE